MISLVTARKAQSGTRPWALLAAALRAVVGWRRRRRSYLALMELNDHMLKDIGVSRGEIEAATVEGRPIRRLTG
jgi:uncharacterized protein YjiS (DUF1127 family)